MSEMERFEKAIDKITSREEVNFTLVLEMLEKIRHEIHKTNTQMVEFNASHQLKLLESKQQILDLVFSKVVDQREFIDYKKAIDKRTSIIENKQEKKVDKSSVRLIWLAITTVGAIAAFLVKLS